MIELNLEFEHANNGWERVIQLLACRDGEEIVDRGSNVDKGTEGMLRG